LVVRLCELVTGPQGISTQKTNINIFTAVENLISLKNEYHVCVFKDILFSITDIATYPYKTTLDILSLKVKKKMTVNTLSLLSIYNTL
jgi:hypothetical protein